MHVSMEAQKRSEIIRWISTIKYDDHHMSAKSGLLENTGEWLFQNARFEEWRSSTSSGFIWLRGKPGAGKTKLTSKVIDALRSESKNEPVVFFYCNRAEEPRRDPSVILHTLLKQLSVQLPSPNLPKLIKEAYLPVKEGGNASSQWEFQKCQDLLLSVSEIYPRTIIVIDALDEIDRDQREVLLEAFHKVVQSSQSMLKIFISSRNYQDIQEALHCDSISAIDNKTDIQRYVEREVTTLIEKRWKDLIDKNVLTKDIVSALISKADGMFLWVDLQVKYLSRIRLDSGIRRDLDNLPKTLKATYKQIYNDTILEASGNEPEVAKKALGWIMVAQRPFQPSGWVGATEIATQEILDLNLLLDMCHNLIATDAKSYVMRYIHLSAREYMEDQDDFNVPRLHTMAAHACLSVLIDNAQPGSPNSESFAGYARTYWANHVELSDDKYMKEDTLKLIRKFLGTPEKPTESYKNYVNSFETSSVNYRAMNVAPQNPLFAASHFNLGRICTELWDWSDVDVNSRNLDGNSALTVASSGGNDVMVRLLLDRFDDAMCDTLPGSDNPLEAAVKGCQSRVVATLLSYRADVAAKLCKTQNPLDIAARNGNVAVVQAVLDLGITISASALLATAEKYWDDWDGMKRLQILLDSDKSFRCTQEVATAVIRRIIQAPSHIKQITGLEKTIPLMQQFLDRGWELELSTHSIAQLIVFEGNKAIDWLLNHENHSFVITEDVIVEVATLSTLAIKRSYQLNSLVALIERCPNLELLENVLQHGAINAPLVNVILDRYPDMKPPKSALLRLAASEEAEGRFIKILDKYPDLAISEDVLIAAAKSRGSAFEMLLARDSSIQVGESVLEASAEYGRLSRVEMILEREPDLEPTDQALEAAARNIREEVEIMKVLLARNDKLQFSDRVLKAALSSYSYNGDEKTTFILSKPGVVISALVLIKAIEYQFLGPVNIVRLLLAGHVDINSVTSEAVLVAAAKDYLKAPTLLELLLNSATDAKVMVKEKKAEDPVETQEESQSLLTKNRKVSITENVLIAAAGNCFEGPGAFKYLLRYDPEIRITSAVADAVMSNRYRRLEIRGLLLSEFRENLTEEALEKFEHYLLNYVKA